MSVRRTTSTRTTTRTVPVKTRSGTRNIPVRVTTRTTTIRRTR